MKQETFRFADRAKRKTPSLACVKARLKSGEVAPSEPRKENAFIKGSGFAKKKIGFSPRYRPESGDKYFTVEPDGIKRVSGDETADLDEAS